MSTSDFWSRRKAAVEAERRDEESREATAKAEAERAALAEKPEAEVLAELGLPDPDTLGEGADFSAFLEARVPEAIRRRALRRLWRSNPVLANLDGLNDYDDDYTQVSTPLGGLKTAYRVGQGFLREMSKFSDDPEETTENTSKYKNSPAESPEVEVAVAEIPDGAGEDEVAEAPREPEQNDVNRGPRRLKFRFLD